jgi:DNA-binding transcriptional LysR family regulator
MELRHLRYFVAVAEELHFRKAADRLHVAQPAVSEQIRKLEQELGVKLFDRDQRRVALTAAGAALLDEARHVLDLAQAAQEAVRRADGRATARVRVGYLPDALPTQVHRAMRHLALSTPAVEVHFTAGRAVRLIEELREHRLDAVVTSLPAPTDGLRVTHLGEQGAVAVLPATHAHAVDDAIALARLRPARLVMLARDVNPAFHNAVVAMCHSAGLSPTVVEVAEPCVEQVLLAVAAGAGPAVLPASTAERFAAPGLRFVALETEGPLLRTAVVTDPKADSDATLGLLHALARAGRPRVAGEPVQRVELAA